MFHSAYLIDLAKTSDLIIRKLLAVKPHEEVLLIADTETDPAMVYALASAARSLGCEYSIAVIPSRRGQPELSNLLPKAIEKAFEGADVVIGLTRTSFAPSLAPIQMKLVFKEKRLRYYSMAFRTPESLMQGGALADYEEIRKTAHKLKAVLEQGNRLTIKTGKGTDFVADVPKPENMPGFLGPFVRIETGWAERPGEEAAFPDGEVFFSPSEHSAHGRLVVDGPIEYIGFAGSPIEVIVKEGRIISVNGSCVEVQKLRDILSNIEDADVIGEVALGINPSSQKDGTTQEEKKALGNCHVGFGIARAFEGSWMAKHKTFIHSDIVIRDVVAEVDGKLMVQGSKIIL
jgi:hypothetical protein